MPPIARVGDTTSHGGVVVGPGAPTVLINGRPAAVVGDLHICSLPPSGHQPTVSPFVVGSPTVMIESMPAARQGDLLGCGATVLVGDPTVNVN